eukprot:TRINITY_DN8475_c0_g1_i1.p1 TRINITY_DN8475_c0_g1~~TRINITY_DN8475_c0_g1_i1.p1  ORF type:complete len:481 (+),score=120.07 TRINITY_DN8475_c0_g1_i1:1028-2470(+)
MRQALQLAVVQFKVQPERYNGMAKRIAAVSRVTSKTQLFAITESLFHRQSRLTVQQQAQLTARFLEKLRAHLPRPAMHETLLKMEQHLDGLAETICDEKPSLADRPGAAMTAQLVSLLAEVHAALQATPAITQTVIEHQSYVDWHRRQLEFARQQLAHAERQHQLAEAKLQRARQDASNQLAISAQAIDATRNHVKAYQANVEQALVQIYERPVTQLSVEQLHVLLQNLSGQKLPLQTVTEAGLTGEILSSISANELTQLIGQIKPLGVAHRVVYCAKKAAAVAQPQLFRINFDVGVARLHDWLEQHNDTIGNKYRQQLRELKVDIFTCAGLYASDLQYMQVAPVDRQKLVDLLYKASMSVQQQPQPPPAVQDNAQPRLEPEVQRRILDQVLEENQALADRLQQQQEQLREVPDQLLCRITMDIMVDPVLAEDGHVYDREAIATWQRQTGMSPMTRQPIGAIFYPVMAMRQMIEDFQQQK